MRTIPPRTECVNASGLRPQGLVAVEHGLVQPVLEEVDVGAAEVGGHALGVQFDRLRAIGLGGGEVVQAHADRGPRGIRLGMTGMQVQDGREVGQRGLEVGLDLFRGRGAIAIDIGAEEQHVAVVRIEQERVVEVRHGLREPAVGCQPPGPCEEPIRFVRFEFDGQIGVVEGPLGFAHAMIRPGPHDDRFRPSRPPPDGFVEILQGLFLLPGHAVADAAGQAGQGNLGSKFDLPGIVGDGQVELSLAAVECARRP